MTDTRDPEPVIGSRLGVDVGRARVGLAATDPAGILASPVATLTRDPKEFRDLHKIVDEASQRNAVRAYVGDPINLKGQKTASTQDAHTFARQLAKLLVEAGLPTQVRLIDERLSTVSATQQLRQAGVSSRKQRSVIDQLAAVAILEHAMVLEQNTGVNTGVLVSSDEEDAVDG
ncbi:Holliday junction resolvase RuvX [Enteractinococcus coprophilus]|uniref:Putative pre-16S rRNA nuclease n=1 Tax=Enteractinococcus coprophilus TaxID=1027633 RepID=A0A543AJI9_9MICC|nr:Holliday junction resolvase RuvX [Enteractinococcus coprophilus]TQL72758.1 putative Holliday junction resolvase [Enteractinococcus coprophilus]